MPSLDERLAILTAQCDVPPPGADIPALTGLLAAAHLELFERDGGVEQLDVAIDGFHKAIELAPDHPDASAFWYFALGVGYLYRSPLSEQRFDYDRAVHWLERNRAAVEVAGRELDEATALLIDAYWDRFYATEYAETSDATVALAQARAVAQAIGAMTVADEDLAAYARMVLGLATIACADESRDRTDLVNGIDLIAGALDALPDDATRFLFASSWLVNAYCALADRDDDPGPVDLALLAGERALGTGRVDHPDWTMLTSFQATAYRMRWEQTRRADDLDRSIAHWRTVVERDGPVWAAINCGELMVQRAELLDDASDLPEAIRLLDSAATEADDSDPLAWLLRMELGLAHHLQWKLAQTPGSLSSALVNLDGSLRHPTPNDEARLFVHTQLILVAYDELRHEGSQPHTEPPPAAARLRRRMADAKAELDRATTASPERRALLFTMLAYGDMYATSYEMSEFDIDQLRDLITQGAALSDPPEGLRALTEAATGMVNSADFALNPDHASSSGVDELVRVAINDQIAGFAERARRILPLALQARSARTGDIRGLYAARSMRESSSLDETAWAGSTADDRDTDAFLAILHVFGLSQRGDLGAARLAIAEIHAAIEHLPDSMTKEKVLGPMARFLDAVTSAATGQPIELLDLPALTPGQTLSWADVGVRLLAAAAQLANAMAGTDISNLRRRVAEMTELISLTSPGQPARTSAMGTAALGELEVARRDPADLAAAARAVSWYEELVALSGPDDTNRRTVTLGLAQALRLSGDADRARTRQLGTSALRAHERRVLLQSGTDHAIESAKQATTDVYRVAAWCLEDRAYEEAIAVLDAGRGLVLRSATASREVADILARAGHAELAAEWRESAGLGRDQLTGNPLGASASDIEVPDDLRLRVLRILDREAADTTLTPLSSVGIDALRAALKTVGADALVYLIPASDACPGTALVVPAFTDVQRIALPAMHLSGSAAEGHVTAVGSLRDMAIKRPGDKNPAQRLDELCRWAWSVAMRPILRHVEAWRLGRTPRLIFIPMGALALVPWHAAYRETEAGPRYAVQDAILSYSVSAQAFAAAAAYPHQRSESALVIGNPSGDLSFAGLEAQAIHERFYLHGTYFGWPRDAAKGAGTPDEVLDWLASTAKGPSTLHFACHANVDTDRPADGHLVLAGGSLTARRLLEVSSLAALVINHVFLAACTTNVTGSDYDEAFSLSTAFIAAGAHTVFGSLWPVPDEDTSVLMYMVHHYLNVDRCSPADALHRAQLWMLDPARQPPEAMPPALRSSVARPQCADPVSWAGFTHLGR